MAPAQAARRVKVQASKRALKFLADQAIGHDLLKGLIELITNADDSYGRIEDQGLKPSGRIEVEIDRRPRKNQTIVRVIDWAEGMSDSRLERCVGGYGEDTSGHSGRGVFGMGLKDTINAFGEGTITSFKDGKKFRCVLHNVDDLDIDPPHIISAADRKGFRNTAGGTITEIVVQNPKVRIPQVDSLRQQLQTHVCLRSIMSDPGRTVVLRDLKSGSADDLHYEFPDGEDVLREFPLDLAGSPEIKATLTVFRASGEDALSQSGSYRTGGILITSKRTVHEASLFGFDDDPHAAKLFGELRCDDIYDLQARGEPIVDKNRNGLKKDHELTRALFEAAKNAVQRIVAAEKEKEKTERETLEREETVRRFRDAVRSLNEIARNELQIGGLGTGKAEGREEREMLAPLDGFQFIPDSYRVVVAERESLKLRIQVDGTTGISVGDRLEVSCDNPHIHILDDKPLVGRLYREEPPLAVVPIQVEGLQANAQGFITAKCNGKSAIAAVEVVSTRIQKEHTPSGGLFKGIKYEEHPGVPYRARFDRKDELIWINTLGPSVDLYFGPLGIGQEYPANQVFVAELVTELACQEIARTKRELKTLDIPPGGIDELEAFNTYLERLKTQHAPIIHKALVSVEHRRK
jgi:hypothetical protein